MKKIIYIYIFMQFLFFYIFFIYEVNLDYRRVWYPILRKQNISFVLIYETVKIIFESVFKDNGRLAIDIVLNFWQYTVLHREGNDHVRWIFMVVRHSSCNALRGTIVLLRREPLKYCLVVYFMKVGDFASLRRGATPF